MANSLQYTVASPTQQPMTPAILSAITSPAIQTGAAAAGQSAAGAAAAAGGGSAQAGVAAGGPLTAATAAAYPYHHLPPIDMGSVAAGLVDWSGLTYTLPAGMYAL